MSRIEHNMYVGTLFILPDEDEKSHYSSRLNKIFLDFKSYISNQS